ncbi:aminoacyl-tRNA hydrolase [Stratiformator vulcanicus]|uniref:Peptidyl-tRNA hydrolase n=1 Tax=Stratiformator vulcanicus TaxID=2527980 RepID=A0A517R6C6_9PLAN|nr:aminoacyl-tRNA hydrolase [Stratiformator vulcanicus]QDT39429.1 Peptidyl-tRNA hydrolase [Stratiformator vulcanicus]
MKLIVGLGNPGREYAGTRHNAGFEVIEELVRRGGSPAPKIKFEGQYWEAVFGSVSLKLLEPSTFMNRSGRSVGAAVQFLKLPLEDLLVICDDMNLEPGRLRLRGRGSAGGSNGMKDIIARLGTDEFPRLRVGIGRPAGRMSAVDHVLGRFREDERSELDIAVREAADGVEMWAREGLVTAMNHVNTRVDAEAKSNTESKKTDRTKVETERPADGTDNQ